MDIHLGAPHLEGPRSVLGGAVGASGKPGHTEGYTESPGWPAAPAPSPRRTEAGPSARDRFTISPVHTGPPRGSAERSAHLGRVPEATLRNKAPGKAGGRTGFLTTRSRGPGSGGHRGLGRLQGGGHLGLGSGERAGGGCRVGGHRGLGVLGGGCRVGGTVAWEPGQGAVTGLGPGWAAPWAGGWSVGWGHRGLGSGSTGEQLQARGRGRELTLA